MWDSQRLIKTFCSLPFYLQLYGSYRFPFLDAWWYFIKQFLFYVSCMFSCSDIVECLNLLSAKYEKTISSYSFQFNSTNIYWLQYQIRSDAQSCPTLCDPMNHTTPGLPVHHHLPEFTQTHVHWVGDAIQPSHPLSSPFPPAANPSQHQSLFQWVNSSYEVAKVLEFQL